MAEEGGTDKGIPENQKPVTHINSGKDLKKPLSLEETEISEVVKPIRSRRRKKFRVDKEILAKVMRFRNSPERALSREARELIEASHLEGQAAIDSVFDQVKNTEHKFVEKRLDPEYYYFVKTDQDVLENVLKARYNLSDEVAKAFSAKVDTAARIQKLRDELEWPPTKIELYEDRKPLPETGKKETAIEFYNRVWKPYADAWLISQDILKNKFGEDKLVPGIKSQCHREHRDFVKHAPPSQVKLNDYLASIDLGGTAQSYLEKNRARANKFRNDTLK